MGVTGLWKLIEPCGKPVPVETLEGKILAVDISIWLHQVVKGFQDNKGSALQNAHLLGLFHRLCKLLFYRVRPIFVFDGCVPQLKRDTIARRQQQRSKLNNEADRIQALLLQSLAKEKVVQEALGMEGVDLLIKSPVKRFGKSSKSDDVDDIFKLPDLPKTSKDAISSDKQIENDDGYCHDSSGFSYTTDDYSTATASTDDSSFDEKNPSHSYYSNLQAIDVRSQHFRNLPADVRHEILVDIKETRKQSSWGRLHELPSRSEDFSAFQMKRLLKRRAVQESLEDAEQEMGGRSLTYAELTNLFTEEGILQPAVLEDKTKQIVSDENTRYLLVRDLKKKLAKTEEIPEVKKEVELDSVKIENSSFKEESVHPLLKKEFVLNESKEIESKEEKSNELGDEYNTDLQLAIALSLEDEESQVYSEKDYDYESVNTLRLNREQRKELEKAATGPARAFMIEYGGMNPDEVVDIMEKSQANFDAELEKLCGEKIPPSKIESSEFDADFSLQISEDDDEVDNTKIVSNSCETANDDEVMQLRISDSEDTDSDLEKISIDTTSSVDRNNSKNLTIIVDIKEPYKPEEDLFADVFDNEVIEISDNSEEINNKQVPLEQDRDKESTFEQSIEKIPVKVDTVSILNSLRKQVDEVKNIKLSDIVLSPTDVKIPKEETEMEHKSEVIEIVDSNDGLKESDSMTIVTTTSPRKSPKTPIKNKSIKEFFETDYVIKRTPEKVSVDEDKDVPSNIPSPFFVNKSSKSREKQTTASPSDSPVHSKVAKVLFADQTAEKTEPPSQPPQTTEEIIKDAAEVLKEQKSAEELKELAADLAKERRNLETERNRQDRMSTSINQKMSMDCQELLRLFGIPYIVAPMEAEAQCAFLDAMEMTNGTITDDSDIWLFGGRTVYKNFFAQNKHVMEFRSDQIEKSFNCDRKKLIQLACLVGSDYTTGIHGIGAVTALEILAAFSGPKGANTDDGSNSIRNINTTILSTLCKFRDWWMTCKTSAAPPGSSARLTLRRKLKNIELHEGFPNVAVAEAYLTPKVDESKEAFLWGQPDVESIREFAKKNFGWTRHKTDEILMPVLKKLNEKRTQATIKNYFNVKSALTVRQLKMSKRVQNAIERMTNGFDEETPEKQPAKAPRKRNRKTKQKGTMPNDEEPSNGGQQMEVPNVDKIANETTSHHFAKTTKPPSQKRGTRKKIGVTVEKAFVEIDDDNIPSCSSKIQKIVPERKVNIPNTKQPIPQVEKSLKEMLKKREEAIAIFKQSVVETKKKRKA